MKPWEQYQEGPWTQFQATDTDDLRQRVAEGMTLQVGPFDTGVEIPQALSEGLAGAGRRFTEIATLGTADTDTEADRLLDESAAATVGAIGADLTTLAGVGGVLRAAGTVPKIGSGLRYVGEALSAPTSLGKAVTGGALYGAATTEDRTEQGVAGAVGSGLGYGIPAAAARVAKPTLQRGAEALRAQGVDLTPGELLGGWVQRIEDGATSIPFVGDFIRSAKGESLESFNRAIIDDALRPIGKDIGKTQVGRQAVDKASTLISDSYDDILPQMNVKLDEQLMDELTSLDAMVAKLPRAQQRYFRNYIDEKVLKPFDNENLLQLGETFKKTDSALRKAYKRLQKSPDVFQQDLGAALRESHASLMRAAKRQNPAAADQLALADQSYAMLSRIMDASGSVGAKNGIFTPAQLVRSVQKSAGRNNFARGRAFGQDIAEAAKDVLPSTVPDSGTPLRAMTGAGLAGGAYLVDPMLLGTMAGAGAMYTRPGVKAMQAAIANRPAAALPLSQGLRALAPVSGTVGLSAYLNQ